jgi:hypothetical protein
MTLTRVLEIVPQFLAAEDLAGLMFAERLYANSGSPTEKQALSDELEKIIVACQREGVSYPPVLLKRKKQLQRREWSPRIAQRAAETRAESSSAIPAAPAGAEPKPPVEEKYRERFDELKRQADMLRQGTGASEQ